MARTRKFQRLATEEKLRLINANRGLKRMSTMAIKEAADSAQKKGNTIIDHPSGAQIVHDSKYEKKFKLVSDPGNLKQETVNHKILTEQ